MPVGRATISGSPYLGVFVRAGEKATLVPRSAAGHLRRDLESYLGVPVHATSVGDSELVGALVAGNSNGYVVGERLEAKERVELERFAPVTELRVRQNAVGNNVLVNDSGALVHPELSDEAIQRIGEALRVPVERGTLAGLGTVGMAGAATNRGVVVHPKATDTEVEVVGRVLGVPVHRSTANFGIPIVGACVVANSRAFFTGTPTTPVEIVHLQEGFQVFD